MMFVHLLYKTNSEFDKPKQRKKWRYLFNNQIITINIEIWKRKKKEKKTNNPLNNEIKQNKTKQKYIDWILNKNNYIG